MGSPRSSVQSLLLTTATRAILVELRHAARDAAAQSSVPYSNRPSGAAVLLSDGVVVPGARVESASYSLVIPAVQNAITTACAIGRLDIVALAVDGPILAPFDIAYARAFLARPRESGWATVSDVFSEAHHLTVQASPWLPLPPVGNSPEQPASGIELARSAAGHAHVPESDFPVACIAPSTEGYLCGVNVEHSDWTKTLCAERNLIGTTISYGLGPPAAVYLSCLRDPTASPCGACRQLLAEYFPETIIWQDRGTTAPDPATPTELLPGFFSGDVLRR